MKKSLRRRPAGPIPFLATAVAEVAKRHPDVEFHARTVKGDIEDGLLQECEEAELLVVERHRDAHLASIGLGTLTRHLIDHAPCPVMITPHSDPVTIHMVPGRRNPRSPPSRDLGAPSTRR